MQHPALQQAETEARTRAVGLEATGKLPHSFTAEHYPMTFAELRELRRLKAAVAAATNADTYVALARGEPVPVARLSRRVVRYHRVRTANGR